MLSLINGRNSNQNHSEIPFYPYVTGKNHKPCGGKCRTQYSYTAVANGNWYNHDGKYFGYAIKIKRDITCNPSFLLPGHVLEKYLPAGVGMCICIGVG